MNSKMLGVLPILSSAWTWTGGLHLFAANITGMNDSDGLMNKLTGGDGEGGGVATFAAVGG
jgi:hypothetical protein